MKRLFLTPIAGIMVMLLFMASNAFGQTPAGPPDNNNGIVTIQTGGQSFTANSTTGTIATSKDNKSYSLVFDTRKGTGENESEVWVQVFVNDSKPIKPGVYNLVINAANTSKSNMGIFNKGPHDNREVSMFSENGKFTLTTLVVTGKTAKISGSYEFTGKNNGIGAAVTVKGSFADVTIAYLTGTP